MKHAMQGFKIYPCQVCLGHLRRIQGLDGIRLGHTGIYGSQEVTDHLDSSFGDHVARGIASPSLRVAAHVLRIGAFAPEAPPWQGRLAGERDIKVIDVRDMGLCKAH